MAVEDDGINKCSKIVNLHIVNRYGTGLAPYNVLAWARPSNMPSFPGNPSIVDT